MTDEAFYQLCRNNSDLRFKQTVKGELIIMPPVGGEGSKREADLSRTDLLPGFVLDLSRIFA